MTVLSLTALLVCGCAWLIGIDKTYVDPPRIDRVGVFPIDKTFLVGDLDDPSDNPEFLWQTTVTDIGEGAARKSIFMTGFTDSVVRIRWEISENLLTAYMTRRSLRTPDEDASSYPDGYVASFFISSHFDIVKNEETKEISESQTGVWNERRYMRVDWARDGSGYDRLDLASLTLGFSMVNYTSLDLSGNAEPDERNAWHFDMENGYFDITNKVFAKPLSVADLTSLGISDAAISACYLGLNPMPGAPDTPLDCYLGELTIRHSALRVDDHDYPTGDWDEQRFRAWAVSGAYSRRMDVGDAPAIHVVNRKRIWSEAHIGADGGSIACSASATLPAESDPHRDLNDNGTEDQCEAAGAGSTCDLVAQKCTLPLQEREPAPVVWHFTNGAALEHFDAAREAVHEWDVALRAAVLAARRAECERTGGADCQAAFPAYTGQMDDAADAVVLSREVDDCREGRAYQGKACDVVADDIASERGVSAGVRALAKMREMAVLCHSPVEDTDPPDCGSPRLSPGTTAAMCAGAETNGDTALRTICRAAVHAIPGDVRYNQIEIVTSPQSAAPWSLSTSADDPATGERISSAVTIWADSIEAWSHKVTDRLRYLQGELPIGDVTSAEDADRWIEAAHGAAGKGSLGTMSRSEVARRLAAMVGAGVGDPDGVDPAVLAAIDQNPTLVQTIDAEKEAVRHVQGDSVGVRAQDALIRKRTRALAYTDVESYFLTAEVQRYEGVGGYAMTNSVLEVASPLRAGNQVVRRDLRHRQGLALAEHDICLLDEPSTPLSLSVLAPALDAKFGAFDASKPAVEQAARVDRIQRYLTRRMLQGVLLHQVGHGLGLRHNFAASADAFHYHPQYWQLRTSNGAITVPCADQVANGKACVGPRWLDPVTDEERDNLISMFMGSSVMDLPGDPMQAMAGLGAYDFSAIRMLYTDTVAVHAGAEYQVKTPRGRGVLERAGDAGGILGYRPRIGGPGGVGVLDIQPFDLQRKYALIEPGSCHPVAPLALQPKSWDETRNGMFHPLLDGGIVTVNGQPSRCRQLAVDYVPWSALHVPSAQKGEVGSGYSGGPALDPAGRPRLVHHVAGDRFADAGNIDVRRHDLGADAWEAADFAMSQEEQESIFDHRGRGPRDLGPLATAERRFARYREALRDDVKGIALLKGRLFEIAKEPDVSVSPQTLFVYSMRDTLAPQALAAAAAIDRFTTAVARPEPGEKIRLVGDPVLRNRDPESKKDDNLPTAILIPEGAFGAGGRVTPGGARLFVTTGEDGTSGVFYGGSYHDKMWTPLLLSESDDRFAEDTIAEPLASLRSAISPADLFPDGYRRWLANQLTADDALKAVRVAADVNGNPVLAPDGFPAGAFGLTSWWAPKPEVCFPETSGPVCAVYGTPDGSPDNAAAPAKVAMVDPAIRADQQTAMLAWAYLHLPATKSDTAGWIALLSVDEAPKVSSDIELHWPQWGVYYARTFGFETVHGKAVQRGIGARVLEHANTLLSAAYQGAWQTGPDGVTQWFLPDEDASGFPVVVSKSAEAAFLEYAHIAWLLARMTKWASDF